MIAAAPVANGAESTSQSGVPSVTIAKSYDSNSCVVFRTPPTGTTSKRIDGLTKTYELSRLFSCGANPYSAAELAPVILLTWHTTKEKKKTKFSITIKTVLIFLRF